MPHPAPAAQRAVLRAVLCCALLRPPSVHPLAGARCKHAEEEETDYNPENPVKKIVTPKNPCNPCVMQTRRPVKHLHPAGPGGGLGGPLACRHHCPHCHHEQPRGPAALRVPGGVVRGVFD